LIVFKLDRERPAFSLFQSTLFYVRDKVIRVHDLSTGNDVGLVNIKKFGSLFTAPRTLSYNPAEKSVLITSVSISPNLPDDIDSSYGITHSRQMGESTNLSRFHKTLPPLPNLKKLLKVDVLQVHQLSL
jgi:hypothetical protein